MWILSRCFSNCTYLLDWDLKLFTSVVETWICEDDDWSNSKIGVSLAVSAGKSVVPVSCQWRDFDIISRKKNNFCCRYMMGFRHFPSLLNEIKKLRKLNTYVDCKLVFSDGSMMVHFAKLLASRIWWTGCRDGDTPPDNLVFIFPNQSIKYIWLEDDQWNLPRLWKW